MKVSGAFGHFPADHVSLDLDPVADLKEKLQSKKAKASTLPIGSPTYVSHEMHWGRDGKKWGGDPSPL